MTLPKIDQPLFDAVIPSTQQKVMFRPFLVKEEKILLVAQQSGNDSEIIRAIKQILGNCIQSEVNIDNLAIFDLEYLFLKLRSRSVNNIIKLSYKDTEDEKIYDFELNLDQVNSKIEINDDVGMMMRYPTADITDKMGNITNEVELMTFFIVNCIDVIYDADNVYPATDYSEKEISEFLDNLDVSTFEKIRKFFESIPRLHHTIKYKNSLGDDREIELTNLKDFFMWG